MTALDAFLRGLGPIGVFALCCLIAAILAGVVNLAGYAYTCAQSVFYRATTPDVDDSSERPRLNAVLSITDFKRGRVSR